MKKRIISAGLVLFILINSAPVSAMIAEDQSVEQKVVGASAAGSTKEQSDSTSSESEDTPKVQPNVEDKKEQSEERKTTASVKAEQAKEVSDVPPARTHGVRAGGASAAASFEAQSESSDGTISISESEGSTSETKATTLSSDELEKEIRKKVRLKQTKIEIIKGIKAATAIVAVPAAGVAAWYYQDQLPSIPPAIQNGIGSGLGTGMSIAGVFGLMGDTTSSIYSKITEPVRFLAYKARLVAPSTKDKLQKQYYELEEEFEARKSRMSERTKTVISEKLKDLDKEIPFVIKDDGQPYKESKRFISQLPGKEARDFSRREELPSG